jgi:zinc protease
MDVVLCSMGENNSASVQVWVAAGSTTEGQWSGTGISHLLEHMIFKGSSNVTGKQIGDRVKGLGGKINAYTSQERTVFFIDCPRENVYSAIQLLYDILSQPLFDKAELEKEKQVILREMDMREDSPDREIAETLWETAFRVHPFRIPIIGYPELFKGLTHQDLLTYYKTFYGSEHCCLVIAGGIDNQEVLKKAEIFSSFSRSNPVESPVPKEPPQLLQKVVRKVMPVDVARLAIGFHGPCFYSPCLYSLDVLSVVLGEGIPSRLYQRLVKKGRLVYSIESWFHTSKDPGLFVIYCTLDSKNFDKAKETIFEEIEKIKQQAVTGEELERAKTLIESEYLFSVQTAHGTAADIGTNFVLTGNPNFSSFYLENIKEVNSASIIEVTKRYLTIKNSSVVELCSEEIKQDIIEQSRRESFPITQINIENGIRLIMKEDPSASIVSIKALFQGGLGLESENKGSSIILSSMLLSGTDQYTSEQIARGIEKLGGQAGTYSGYNSIGLTIEVPPAKAIDAVHLLHHILSHSIFPEDEFHLKIEQAIAAAKQGYEQPINIAVNRFRKEMFGTHPYSSPPNGEPDLIKNITRKIILNEAKRIINPPNMVISIFGNFLKKKIENELKDLFVQMKPQAEFKAESVDVVFPGIAKVVRDEFKGEGACVVIGFPGTTIYSDDRYSLDVLANAMNDQGGSLYHSLRNEKALAYSLGCVNILGLQQGAFVFYILTSNENVEKAYTELKGFISSLKKQGIDENSIEPAKAEAIGTQVLQTQTQGGLGFAVGLDVLYGLNIDTQDKYAQKITQITIKDTKKVLDKYFDENKSVTVILTSV